MVVVVVLLLRMRMGVRATANGASYGQQVGGRMMIRWWWRGTVRSVARAQLGLVNPVRERVEQQVTLPMLMMQGM